jgi:hypothetical protein
MWQHARFGNQRPPRIGRIPRLRARAEPAAFAAVSFLHGEKTHSGAQRRHPQ